MRKANILPISALLLVALSCAACVVKEYDGPAPASGGTPAPAPAAPVAGPAPAATPAPAPVAVTPSTPAGTAVGAPTGGPSSGMVGTANVGDKVLRAPVITKPISFGGTTQSNGTVRGEVFEIPVNTAKLPDFSTLKPVATIWSQSWDVSPRKFTEGFPGVTTRVEWFAIRWDGKLRITNGGAYSFKMISDDGAKMYIDGSIVINDDGTHPPKEATGSMTLNAGEHALVIEYFQGPKYEIALQIWVSSPSLTQRIMTSSF